METLFEHLLKNNCATIRHTLCVCHMSVPWFYGPHHQPSSPPPPTPRGNENEKFSVKTNNKFVSYIHTLFILDRRRKPRNQREFNRTEEYTELVMIEICSGGNKIMQHMLQFFLSSIAYRSIENPPSLCVMENTIWHSHR